MIRLVSLPPFGPNLSLQQTSPLSPLTSLICLSTRICPLPVLCPTAAACRRQSAGRAAVESLDRGVLLPGQDGRGTSQSGRQHYHNNNHNHNAQPPGNSRHSINHNYLLFVCIFCCCLLYVGVCQRRVRPLRARAQRSLARPVAVGRPPRDTRRLHTQF